MSAWDPTLKRVLIVRTGAIGDVVNALSLAAALKAAPTPVAVGWMVHPLSAPLLRGNPLVDELFEVPRDEGLGGYRRAVRAARARGWDMAIDLQRITKSALMARRSGARRVLGWDRARAKEGAWLWVKERVARTDEHKHMVEQYGDFARYLGLAPCEPYGLLPRSPESAARWSEESAAWRGPAVVLNLGASTAQKRWLPERFGAVAAALEADGFQVLLTGNGEQDRATEGGARAAAHAAGAQHVISLVDGTSLLDLVELFARTRLFIGCDTGPMHMAVALRCPTLALIGTGDARRTGPYGASRDGLARVLFAGERDDPATPFLGTPAPMPELSAERVLSAARALLGT